MGGREKDTNKHKKNTVGLTVFLVFMSLFPVTLWAQAGGSVVIPGHPRGVDTVTDTFRMRERHPVTGQRRMHNGVDYRARTPTTVQTNGPVTSCQYSNGYGFLASVTRSCANGNTVTERYAHLTRCPAIGATSVLTGNSGVGTGPHLHYEVMLGGSFVDPQAAFTKDLCNSDIRRDLLEDARKKGAAGGGGGVVAPTNPTTGGGGGGGGSGGGSGTGGDDGSGSYHPPPPASPITPAIIPPTTSDVVPTTDVDGEITGCSTDTWTAIVNQSVLQTRREMLMNQRYIAKADSVLVYSCFQDMYTHAGETLGIFSETQRWANIQVDIIGRVVTVNVNMGAYSLDGAIANAVDSAVSAYLDSNFNHEFLGGTLTGPLASSSGGGGSGGDDNHSHTESQYGYPCGTMSKVWQMAKCHNATDTPLFYKFEDLIDNDPRIYPHNYACKDSGITQGMIDIARHKNVRFDNIKTYLDITHLKNGGCSPPIPTGVSVHRRKGEDRISEEVIYDDALCITAGCGYQNPNFSGLGTCEIMAPTD